MAINKNVEANLSNIFVSDTSDGVIAYAENIYQETWPNGTSTALKDHHKQKDINVALYQYVNDQKSNLQSTLDSEIQEVRNKANTNTTNISNLNTNISNLKSEIGTSQDNYADDTIYGKIKKAQRTADTINELLSDGANDNLVNSYIEIRDFLNEFSKNDGDLASKLNTINTNITTLQKDTTRYSAEFTKSTYNLNVGSDFNTAFTFTHPSAANSTNGYTPIDFRYLKSTYSNTAGGDQIPTPNKITWTYRVNNKNEVEISSSNFPSFSFAVSGNQGKTPIVFTGNTIADSTLKRSATATVYKHYPIYCMYSASNTISNMNNVTDTTYLSFTSSGTVTINVPYSGTGNKYVVIYVPSYITLATKNGAPNITQPDGMNLPFAVTKQSNQLTKSFNIVNENGGTTTASMTYNVYVSSAQLDSSKNKSLDIKISSQTFPTVS